MNYSQNEIDGLLPCYVKLHTNKYIINTYLQNMLVQFIHYIIIFLFNKIKYK